MEHSLGDLNSMLLIRPQIIQCISNLLHNSIQAYEQQEQSTSIGIIHIHSYMHDDHVVISIEDNGTGIAQENMQKIFDPFFTTKDSNSGSGLGLSIVATICEQHQGTINYQPSKKLGGAQFIIRIFGCKDS